MPKIPKVMPSSNVKRGLALIGLVVENWPRVKIMLRPALDRGLRLLLSRAEAQGALTVDDIERLAISSVVASGRSRARTMSTAGHSRSGSRS